MRNGVQHNMQPLAHRTRARGVGGGSSIDHHRERAPVSVAHPMRRALWGWRRGGWTDVVAAYLAQPHDLWGPQGPRHADKLEATKQAIRERDGLRDDEIVDAVLSMAAARRTGRPAPVYVTGLGGSGSHWLSGMLNDLDGLVAAGEVYFPRPLLKRLRAFGNAGVACGVDAVHLLHAWPRSVDVAAASVVNCAAGIGKLPSYKRWDPASVGVYLMRDPRDQVLSVTFRKASFRRYEDPDATDEQYLQRMAGRNVASYRDYLAVADHVDVACKYEDLCSDPRPVLRGILQALGRAIDEQRVNQVAVDHDAERIRAGRGATISNLNRDGRARPWHEVADSAQQRMLHTHLIDVIHGLGYAPGDCMGTHPPDSSLPSRTITFHRSAPGPLYQRVDGMWQRLDTAQGTITVPAGTPVLLRIGTDDPDNVRALDKHGGDDVQALCLAGNNGVNDRAIRHLRGLTGLQTLDLARTRVTDAGLTHLASLDRLLQLNLADTRTTAQGRARLAARRSQLTIWD